MASSTHSTLAEQHERELHLAHDAAKNPLFYNKKNGIIGFRTTTESTKAHKKTINSERAGIG